MGVINVLETAKILQAGWNTYQTMKSAACTCRYTCCLPSIENIIRLSSSCLGGRVCYDIIGGHSWSMSWVSCSFICRVLEIYFFFIGTEFVGKAKLMTSIMPGFSYLLSATVLFLASLFFMTKQVYTHPMVTIASSNTDKQNKTPRAITGPRPEAVWFSVTPSLVLSLSLAEALLPFSQADKLMMGLRACVEKGKLKIGGML